MKIHVYKGFDEKFLDQIDEKPLVAEPITNKKNVLYFDKKTRKQIDMALLLLDENDTAWITYEEYTLVKKRIDDVVEEEGLELTIYKNNLFPDYYPIEFKIGEELKKKIIDVLNGDNVSESVECQNFINIFNTIIDIHGNLYAGFYNYEYENAEKINVVDYYPLNISVEDSKDKSEYDIFLNEDIETYLRDYEKISILKPKIIGLKSTNGETAKRIQRSLQAYCKFNDIRLIKYYETIPKEDEVENELIEIAKNVIKIEKFSSFREIKFYKNPDIDKETCNISQGQIVQEIIRQAENSYNENNNFRDIFITASTGAGKSVMFQIPAVYLAKKYNKLTVIIEPVKALMQDQKEKLQKTGFTRVEAFNSDLITQIEKETVLKRIKNGEVDLLYLSPETLLSYSIETIIGDREIGLLIVDEAHIVTTWGVGFRPDYWYLGSYLNKLRNRINVITKKALNQKIYHFPICAFTATAINGGIDDSVSDTIISLYMENPIKYIGYVRRDDIGFEITHHDNGEKLPSVQYESKKCLELDKRIKYWLSNNEKTIVYFPYAALVSDASKGMKSFAGISTDKRIGTYTGRNVEERSNEAFTEFKKQVFESFRNGSTPIMFATKAFGMGVDVNDVKNVYHYAVSGNLCDYVQEIGRAARKSSINGKAITDYYYNDMKFMKVLFGMSQIKQYQIKKVLEGIYDTYKNKKGARNFLISPESFTYIFNGKDEDACISKLKICLLMLEKDFYDKYNFKVMISRPQSIFTKAFVCVHRTDEKNVLISKYGKYISFVTKGRSDELQPDGCLLSDGGDIYAVDLKSIWEDYYPNISFPQFKYWYFNFYSTSKDKIEIMPEIRASISPRQKISVESRGELLLSELREKILLDFEYIADSLYKEFGKQYFTTDEFAKVIRDRYGMSKARIISNSLFDLVDPDGHCIKHRSVDNTGKTSYTLSNGNFKEYMRRPINKAQIMHRLSMEQGNSSYTGYLNLMTDDKSNIALKLLSIFDYANYEISGGEEPEIFIRLNDPNKIKNIVMGNMFYSNGYVTKAKQKHDRDVAVLLRFFNDLKTDNDRWNYIEDYFLGYDVLIGTEPVIQQTVKMSKSIDKEHSYPTNMYREWNDFKSFFDENDHFILQKLSELCVPIPEYLETTIKKSDEGKDLLMSWPSKDTLICQQDTSNGTLEYFERKGWHAYRIYEIDYDKIKKELS